MGYLVVMEVSQKQNYIFKTNRLAENIGASILIRDVTEVLPGEKASETAARYGEHVQAVLEGGGKSVYEFESENGAKAFIRSVSRTVLEQYPGMALFMAMEGYDTEKESVIDAINRLYGKLEEKKSRRASAFRLFDLGIAKQCESTQHPAVVVDDRGRYVSAESETKLRAARNRQKELFAGLLPETDDRAYRFANEFSELGGTGGSKNYMAVVVVDGNKMGRRLETFRDDFKKKHPVAGRDFNEDYKKAIGGLSQEIDENYQKAMKAAVRLLARRLDFLREKGITIKQDGDGTIVLPMRPLILAGDDICFVTDARIGLAVTKKVLEEIEHIHLESMPDTVMSAGAGIAMVRVQYPFFRAHALAEELCHSAKAELGEDDDASVLDFHVVQGELEGSIFDIRREKYHYGKLTSKPYYLHEREDTSRTMPVFDEHMDLLGKGLVGRGVIKEYRNALSAGEAAARQYVSDKRLDRRMMSAAKTKMPDSYIDGRCIDFDVLEVMDLYYPLEEKQ